MQRENQNQTKKKCILMEFQRYRSAEHYQPVHADIYYWNISGPLIEFSKKKKKLSTTRSKILM